MADTKIVYVDKVDWNWEIGEARGGSTVYPSLKDLKENNPCWKGCGVVKCTMTYLEEVEPENIEEIYKK